MTKSNFTVFLLKKKIAVAAAVVGVVFSTQTALATVLVWSGTTGGGAKTDWNTKGDWTPNSATGGPTSADTASFDGTSAQTSSVLSAAGSAGSISFSGALGYTISSPSFILTISGLSGVGITNTSSAVQTISAPLSVGGSQSWDTSTGGTLAVSGAVTFGASSVLTVQGAGATNISGALTASGASNSLVKSGTGTLTMSGSGATTINSVAVNQGTLSLTRTSAATISNGLSVASTGTLSLGASSTLGSSTALTVNGGHLNISSGISQTFGSLALSGASVFNFATNTSETISFTTGATSLLTGGNSLTLSGYSYNSGAGNKLEFVGQWADDNTLARISINGVRAVYDGATGFLMADPLNTPAIPEPSTYAALAGLAALGLAIYRRRQARSTVEVTAAV